MANLKVWIEAARPKTLTASISPVLLGCALAYTDGKFNWIPALLCLFVALFAQIASNYANDYFDHKKGADREDRLGPDRAVALGWVKPKSMLIATLISLGLSCIVGLFLIQYGGWELIFVGLAIAVFALAYSAGPYPLAYHGLGDVCVLLFYGVVPVVFTYYVQANTFTVGSLLAGLALGFVAINILVVNNYRDYDADKLSNKQTTIVKYGKAFGLAFYIFNALAGMLFFIAVTELYDVYAILAYSLAFIWIALFILVYRKLTSLEGKALNAVLASTAKMVFLFAVLLSVLIVFCKQ